MLKVYRFLNPQGAGLYQDDFWQAVGLEYVGEDIPFYQPVIYEDVKGWKWSKANNYFCAFETINQLLSWFRNTNPLNIFIEGGSLVEITIAPEDVLYGRAQCLYHKHKVQTTRNITSDEFIDLIDPHLNKFTDLLMW